MTEHMPFTAIGIAICAVVIFVFVPRQLCACIDGESRGEMALQRADYLADYAADSWKRHQSCPRAEAAVGEDDEATIDPWDHRFRITCGEAGVTITSAGADGRFGTPDDITMGRR